jgi:hypothetical protein
MSTTHSRWPLYPVPYARAKNGQPGYNDLLASPAANASTLADWVDGLGAYGAPLNPSSEPGHDHSGGHFGKPLFCTVASLSLDGPQGTTGVIYPQRFRSITLEDGAGGTTTNATMVSPTFIWVPPCDPSDGAYVNLGISARVDLTTTTLTASDVLTVYFKVGEDEQGFTITGPNSTGVKNLASSSTSERVSVRVGQVNLVEIRATVVRAAGGSSRGCRLDFDELELGVYST